MVPEHLHDAILLAFVQGHSVPALAAHFKVPLRALSEWLSSPPVVALRDSLRELADAQAALATAHARVTAILTLESVAKGAQVSEDVFRASALLIRNTPRANSPSQMGARAGGWAAGTKAGARRTGSARRSHQPDASDEAPHEAPHEPDNTGSRHDSREQTDTSAQPTTQPAPRSQRTDSPEPRSHADRAREGHTASARAPAEREALPV